VSVFVSDIADERQRFDLFVDRDMAVLPCVPLEVCDDDAGERTDGRQLRRPQLVFGGNGGARRDGFVSRAQHEHERAQAAVLVE